MKNRAERVITGDNYEIRSHEILNKLGWEPLYKRRENKMISYMTKATKKQCPVTIAEMFTFANNETYQLRSNNQKLVLPKPCSNAMKRSFSYAAAKTWNSLSNEKRKLV